MNRTLIGELGKHIGETVSISGWVDVRRDQGKMVFFDFRDVSGMVQGVVLPKEESALKTAKELRPEFVVKVEGLVNKRPEKNCNPNVQNGNIELEIKNIHILSVADPNLPIQVHEKNENEAAQQHRLDWRWIDLRKPENALIFKVWTAMEQSFMSYCVVNGYIQIHSPKTVVTSTESGSELFEVKYFNQKASLAQSPQLYKQMAMASGFEKVFEIGPVFRANPSFTSRHDTEFTMYDVEISFIESHLDLLTEEEKMMVAIIKGIKEKHGVEIQKTFGEEIIVPTIPFPRLTFKEAKAILKDLEVPSPEENDFSPEEERAISQYIKEKKGHDFLFVHEWPTVSRAFYSMRFESDPTLTKSFDLLYKGLEITSGAQREHRYNQLKQQIIEKGFNVDAFETYLNFFKYGCPPHGGFAPGPSRIVMKMLGLSNVREVTYLYRGPNRLTP